MDAHWDHYLAKVGSGVVVDNDVVVGGISDVIHLTVLFVFQ